jgi:hypothetical protein
MTLVLAVYLRTIYSAFTIMFLVPAHFLCEKVCVSLPSPPAPVHIHKYYIARSKILKIYFNLQHWLLQPLQLEVSEAMQSSDIFYRVSQAFAFHGDVGFKETFQQNFLRIKQKPYDHMHNCAGLLMLKRCTL